VDRIGHIHCCRQQTYLVDDRARMGKILVGRNRRKHPLEIVWRNALRLNHPLRVGSDSVPEGGPVEHGR
jgi:hypothetical protein